MLRDGLRVSVVAAVAVGAALLSWLIGRIWLDGGNQPWRTSWLAVLLLVAMAATVLAMGRRMWRHRRRGDRVEPLVAARILGLAQASALTGALVGGGYLGQAVALLPDLGFGRRGEIALWHAGAALAGLAVAAAGLLVQSWCRVREDDDQPPDRERHPA